MNKSKWNKNLYINVLIYKYSAMEAETGASKLKQERNSAAGK